MDDRKYFKEDKLEIYYNSGELEDGTVLGEPYLMVARYKQDMTVVNRFHGDEAAELYKKLTEYNFEDYLREHQRLFGDLGDCFIKNRVIKQELDG